MENRQGTAMEEGDFKEKFERAIGNKSVNPEKYGMVVCSCCNSKGFIQNPQRQCCPKCGGFGFIKKE